MTNVKLGHKRFKVASAPPLMKSVSMKLRDVSLAARVVTVCSYYLTM
jgi:hypothetical protein